jgi:hypothetical protein
MNRFSASEAALEGFRLTRERWGTILAWSGVYFVGITIIALLMMASLGPDFVEMAKKGRFTPEDAEAVAGMLAQSWPAFLLVLILVVALMSLLTAGIYRLVLRPDEKGFVHLRLGADELRLTLINLLLFGVGMVCLVAGFVATAAAETIGPALAIPTGAVILGLTVWVGVRLSLATPMTFALRKISIGPAWEMTRHRFWPLFGMIVLAAIFYVMIWLLLNIIGIAVVTVAGGGQAIGVGSMTPGAALAALVTVIMQFLLSVLQVVMIYAPFAVAYQQMHGDAVANR